MEKHTYSLVVTLLFIVCLLGNIKQSFTNNAQQQQQFKSNYALHEATNQVVVFEGYKDIAERSMRLNDFYEKELALMRLKAAIEELESNVPALPAPDEEKDDSQTRTNKFYRL